MANSTREQIEKIVEARWSIEVYHRELKQAYGIESCQARRSRAQRNHMCLAVFAWLEVNKRRINQKITLYQQTWEVIKTAIQHNLRWLWLTCNFVNYETPLNCKIITFLYYFHLSCVSLDGINLSKISRLISCII